MVAIYCANKMSKWLREVKPLPLVANYQNSWNANLFKVEGKNYLLCVHNPTAYCLLFPEIKKADTKNFKNWFLCRLTDQFSFDGIDPALATSFPVEECGFFKTNNQRRTIGILTTWISEIKYSLRLQGVPAMDCFQHVNRAFNKRPVGGKVYTFPVENMREFLL